MKTELTLTMVALGFVDESTGGGCCAFGKKLPNGDWVLICNENSALPKTVGEGVWLSRLREGQLLYENFEPSVLHAVAKWAVWDKEAV